MTVHPFCILIDIDGTLALKGDRAPYDFSKVLEDSLNQIVHDLLLAYLFVNPEIKPIFVSGRSDICFAETREWLLNNCKFLEGRDFALLMRPNEDYRADYTVKEELYLEHVKPFYEVKFVLDDRNSVVKMWRNQGLTCLQVADGDF